MKAEITIELNQKPFIYRTFRNPNYLPNYWGQWCVEYRGKRNVLFPNFSAALAFALYVARHPHVMEDQERK